MTLINAEVEMATITTTCICEPDENCYGECFEWQEDDARWLIQDWQKANGIDPNDPILIEVDRIGWTNASAYKWTTANEVYKSLYLNGDFRIEFTLTENVLAAIRYSHDEPTGTGIFSFTHYKGCEKCGEPVKADIHAEELGFCVECQHAYFESEK